MICISFLKIPYFTFVRWWIAGFKNKFNKHYLIMGRMDLSLRDVWIPESITKFGLKMKIRSIQDARFPWMWVGSFVFCCNPNWEVIASILKPSKVVASLVNQLLDIALKPPMVAIKNGLVAEHPGLARSCRRSFQSHIPIGLETCNKETKLQILSQIFISLVIDSYEYWLVLKVIIPVSQYMEIPMINVYSPSFCNKWVISCCQVKSW